MGQNSEDQDAPLLSETEHDAELVAATAPRPRTRLLSWLGTNIMSLTALTLLAYIAILLTINTMKTSGSLSKCKGAEFHDSLPRDVIEYEEKQEWYTLEHPWNMKPSPELDDLWEDLLYALNIRVTPEELYRLNKNSTNRIQVDGGDYLGVLGVYHHLHCLNNLRRLVHWDYYESMFGEEESNGHGPFDKGHSDHCINAIRQALMCHANVELHTGIWVYDPQRPQASQLGSHSQATCVKWDSLNNWARSRALVPGEYTYRPVPYDKSLV
ncbi:Protein of unknown function DUF3328 [Apiospora arundinis]